MSERRYTIGFFGWCFEAGPAGKSAKHDKIWGYFTLSGDRRYCFWGRRGGRLGFKKIDPARYRWDDPLMDLVEEKRRKGYREITGNDSEITAAWPDFHDDMEKQFFVAKLGEKVRNEETTWAHHEP